VESGRFLKTVYIAMGVGLCALVLVAWAMGSARFERDAVGRAEFFFDIVQNGIVSLMVEGRGGEAHDLIEHISSQSIRSFEVEPLAPGSPAPPSTAVLKAEGADAYVNLVFPIPNQKTCQRCHNPSQDALGVVRVALDVSASYRRLKRERAVLGGMALAVAGLLGGAIAFACRRRSAPPAAPPVERERPHPPESQATIGQLASVIAHEIKNPLAGISGAIQVLAEGFDPGDPRKEIMGEVLGEIARLDRAVRDLLAYARPSEPSIMPMPMGDLVAQSVRMIEPRARERGVDVVVGAADDVGMVPADPVQMAQVFHYVFLNSLKAMPSGGVMSVCLRTRDEGGRRVMEATVADTGPGLAPEDLDTIFMPFFSSRRTDSGLGLAISRNIVRAHGGRLLAESQPGSGTVFRIIIPLEGNE
jgi:signal transduction histidine kinase